jgi:hypothetical protein
MWAGTAQSVKQLTMGWMAEQSQFWVPLGAWFFSSPVMVLGPIQPPIQWVPRAPSSGVERPGHEADHSLPTSAQVKNMWIYICIPPYVFMAQCLISWAQGQLYLFHITHILTIYALQCHKQFNSDWRLYVYPWRQL